MKNPKKVAAGKKSRIQGKAFELKVRKDLEEKGWIVDKWTNNIEFEKANPWVDNSIKIVENVTKEKSNMILKKEFLISGKLVPAKAKWAGPGRPMMMGAGFPDFIAFQCRTINGESTDIYDIIGVESKMTGKLDKEEKEKCTWYLDNQIFSKILIASKTKVKNKIVVNYGEFQND